MNPIQRAKKMGSIVLLAHITMSAPFTASSGRSTGKTFTPRAASGSGTFVASGITGLAGANAQIRFQYIGGATPGTRDGVWLDDLRLTCIQPVGQTTGYDFLDGTSMAAPHVTGAAGLLFSLNPSATVAQVRSAILGTVHPVAALQTVKCR